MTKHYLFDRTWDKAGLGWTDPLKLLQDYKPVIWADYTDTTSSAGDWGGCMLVKIRRYYYLVPFNQESRYPYYGYRLYTGKPIIRYENKPDDPIDDYIEYLKDQERAYLRYRLENV